MGRTHSEIYGFVGWSVTFAILFLYFVYSFVPETWLHQIGITYYPDKYWATSVPAFLCMIWMAGFFLNYFYLHYSAYPLDDIRCIQDEKTNYLKREHVMVGAFAPESSSSNKNSSPKLDTQDEIILDEYPTVPIVRDIPLDIVNELLFEN
ncbi:hypothetical protein C9374_013986 [Naegleria lovaniensis]|uniref:PIG-P domain-containing protein n=1 Tax=Naegleria lovaniensis TaxID=51637 RepID=A0AA88KQ86_NAELO|nr:uncharacterized protein C9374_013986 [Naegleria lovaniensis]KAG2389426.1 hypothetical protein C9374_013986 [Naegleria lovaniensis]